MSAQILIQSFPNHLSFHIEWVTAVLIPSDFEAHSITVPHCATTSGSCYWCCAFTSGGLRADRGCASALPPSTPIGSTLHIRVCFKCFNVYNFLFITIKATYVDCHITIDILICTLSDYRCCSVVSSSLQLHGLQHTRLPCPSPSAGVCSNSCPLNQRCCLTISSSVVPFPFAFNLSQHQNLFQ